MFGILQYLCMVFALRLTQFKHHLKSPYLLKLASIECIKNSPKWVYSMLWGDQHISRQT
ncbi:hypothetical protein GPLA_3150 [Paraglaciecola polaris LMG 21857]|uniref:Uncharacterized protein n=1 Tax=Paraglaciecola polaris LMG 21857 TaxID=1129793 RepID=K6ZD62_9ALTE|nr:hypothetical protein GPLA_3150 [Paraglaciecola polaris LMG 21857]